MISISFIYPVNVYIEPFTLQTFKKLYTKLVKYFHQKQAFESLCCCINTDMAVQTSIGQYFNSRKRHAVDEINKVSNPNKVLILDKNINDVSVTNELDSANKEDQTKNKQTIIYTESPTNLKPKRILTTAPKLQKRTPRTASGSKQKIIKFVSSQGDIRKSLLASFDNVTKNEPTREETQLTNSFKTPTKVVPLDVKGIISPSKKDAKRLLELSKKSEPSIAEVNSDTNNPATRTPVKISENKDNLKTVRSKLIRSSRLDEIKKALQKVNDGHAKLKELGEKIYKKSKVDESHSKINEESADILTNKPAINKFQEVVFEFVSPKKSITEPSPSKVRQSPSLLRRSILMSPGKIQSGNSNYVSPRKLFTESSPVKTPSYERFSSLTQGISLPLPFSYRSIAETFRAVDAVVSMLYNRNEAIHFPKLRVSVQQMSKKNLSEKHLGQILAVYPNSFTVKQEKLRQAPGQVDKYELSITPIFDVCECVVEGNGNKSGNKRILMTPSILLERKRTIYNALLDMTRDYHQEFLATLDPPIQVDKYKVTRWHPEFDVDGIPEITPFPIAQPPNMEKFSSAKDVLIKARDMFMHNPRMERALEKISNEMSQQYTTPASAAIPALASALKGIPKSLLEKVRARQAAKAAAVLTRDPETMQTCLEHSRLPELTRILRNIFVGEKKNVLLQELVLKKLGDSFRENLSRSSLIHHLDLLIVCSPGWLTKLTKPEYSDEVFFKIRKDIEMSKVLNDIEKKISTLT